MQSDRSLENKIAEINLSYLIVAQQMLRTDKATALFRLGISEQVAETIDALRPSQLLKIAQSGTLICQMRPTDNLVWDLLSDHASSESLDDKRTASQLHARVLMASKHSEVIE